MDLFGYGQAKCKNCGAWFSPRNKSNVYCSKECCTEYNSAKAKKKYSEEQGRRPYVIFERDGFRCYYCGSTPADDGVRLGADHIHPRAKGGEDIASNLVTSCVYCNSSKGAKEHSGDNLDNLKSYVEKANERCGILNTLKIKM